MLACRSLLGLDQALRVATTRAALNRLGGNSQGHCSYRVFSYARRKSYTESVMNKKRKSANLVWRAVSAHPASSGESEFADHVVEVENVLNHATSSSVAFQDNHELMDAEEVLADGITTSLLLNSTGNGGTGDAVGASISPGSHSASLMVGASVMKFIREKREFIEEETGVNLIFPSSKKEHSIVIQGKSADCITKASEKIQSAVKSPSLDYSHFISLPLAIHPELIDKLNSFQKSILKDVGFQEDENTEDKSADAVPLVSYAPKASRLNASSSKPGFGPLRIERSIFINPKNFHLTVLMLKLWNEERVHSAMEIFQSVSSQVIEALDGRPIFVRLTGLVCMKGSLRNAQVLYIPIEEMGNEGRLVRACKVITDAYVKAGLVLEKDATRSLKLHATVMNSRHRTRTSGPKKNIPFDATGIFDQYGSEEWGDYNIREVHLSQRCVVVAAFDWVLPQQPH
ncbi:Activating signal cointegrator 1 complex subunit 1-like protein [Drosera capensis]